MILPQVHLFTPCKAYSHHSLRTPEHPTMRASGGLVFFFFFFRDCQFSFQLEKFYQFIVRSSSCLPLSSSTDGIFYPRILYFMTSKQVKKLLIRSSLDKTLILDPEVPTFFQTVLLASLSILTRFSGYDPVVLRWILETSSDPSAGSPTETLLRLLLPLDDQV